MGGKILVILGIVAVFGVGLYIYNSGAADKGFTFFNALSPLYSSSTKAPPVVGPTYQSGPSYIAPANNSVPATGPLQTPPEGFTVGQLSPYFHQVRFGGVTAGNVFSYGQISLYAYPAQSVGRINITGWQIKSNRSGEYISQAVNLYDPSGLTPATDILLGNGDFVNLYSTAAPVNLRLNKCLGYLPNKTQFLPQLPQTCPYVDRSAIAAFSGSCQNYINSIGNCQTPNLSSPYIPQNDYACRDYLQNHFSYYSCFSDHQTDTDFLSHEIRVWTGASPIDPFHDRVLLLDRNGLLVDMYTY